MRLGHLFGRFLDDIALMGGTATTRVLSGANMVTNFNTIITDYNNGTASPSTINTLYSTLSAWQNAQSVLASGVQGFARQTLVDMINTDLAGAVSDYVSAIKYLNRQMIANSTTFNATTVSNGALTAVGTPNGNPVTVISQKNPDGTVGQYGFTETLILACTADSITGGATAGRETVRVKGAAPAASNFAYNWPAGSGAVQSLTAVDGTQNNGGGNANLLVNGDFLTATTANYPDNWVIAVGAAGTDFKQGGNPYTTSGGNLEIDGDGSTLPSIYQQFATTPSTSAGAGGTAAKLAALTPYHVNGWLKIGASAPAAGVLTIDLVDGTNTVINDANAVANSFTLDLTTQTTAYASFSGVFRTPANPPATMRLRLRTSTAITSTKKAYLGRLSLCQPVQLYPGGPFVSLHSGNAIMLAGDNWTQSITYTLSAWARELERYFAMRANNLELPSTTSSPTVADALIA